MTFPAIAEAVAQAFPPDRRVGKSTIHKWVKRHRTRPAQPLGMSPDHRDSPRTSALVRYQIAGYRLKRQATQHRSSSVRKYPGGPRLAAAGAAPPRRPAGSVGAGPLFPSLRIDLAPVPS